MADELINTQSTLLSSNPNISIFPTEQADNEINKSNKKPNPADRGVSKIVIEKIAKTSRIDMPLQITRANKYIFGTFNTFELISFGTFFDLIR